MRGWLPHKSLQEILNLTELNSNLEHLKTLWFSKQEIKCSLFPKLIWHGIPLCWSISQAWCFERQSWEPLNKWIHLHRDGMGSRWRSQPWKAGPLPPSIWSSQTASLAASTGPRACYHHFCAETEHVYIVSVHSLFPVNPLPRLLNPGGTIATTHWSTTKPATAYWMLTGGTLNTSMTEMR